MRSYYISLIFLIFCINLWSQSPAVERYDPAYHTYDRMDILQLSDTSMTDAVNNFDKKKLTEYLRGVWENDDLSEKDRYDILHVLSDNYEFLENEKKKNIISKVTGIFKSGETADGFPKKIYREYFDKDPILKYFYKSPTNFLQLMTPSFQLFINPVVQVNYYNQVNNENPVFQNTRGVKVRGYIDNKVYFYTELLENQRNYFSYTEQRIAKFNALPGQTFYKSYHSSVIDKLKGYDFFTPKAYFGFNATKSINIEFGQGNHFIGNGYRSLLLSDYGPSYLYLKFNTRVWKFHYQNIFAELTPVSSRDIKGDNLLPKKYAAMHYLGYKPHNRFEIGIFESVIFDRPNHFELYYLNPIILYRAVEHQLGSPDNVVMGMNIKWNIFNRISLYSQLVMNEFKLSEVKKQNGWWANKFGAQAGIKYINALGIDHLDLQLEYNVVRPYTYTHRRDSDLYPNYSLASYSHYKQPLAHPLGANFREMLLLLRYKPTDRLYILAKGLFSTYGDDGSGENWGGNILLPYETRQMDEGNFIGQGIKNQIKAFEVNLNYEVFHNYFIDLQGAWRQTHVVEAVDQHYLGGGIRINIATLSYDY